MRIGLNGNEQQIHKYVSELLGKETIDTNTYGRSTGRSGNYSTNYQNTGRELMTPDEVRMLDNRYSLLFVRGERPVKDLKYDILKHPNIALTEDGGAAPFLHGIADKADFSIQLTSAFLDHEDNQPAEPTGYELLSEEDLQREFEEGESFNDQEKE